MIVDRVKVYLKFGLPLENLTHVTFTKTFIAVRTVVKSIYARSVPQRISANFR